MLILLYIDATSVITAYLTRAHYRAQVEYGRISVVFSSSNLQSSDTGFDSRQKRSKCSGLTKPDVGKWYTSFGWGLNVIMASIVHRNTGHPF